MIIDSSLLIAFFVAGFSVAVIVFYGDIRLGVQIKREARKKAKETVQAPILAFERRMGQ